MDKPEALAMPVKEAAGMSSLGVSAVPEKIVEHKINVGRGTRRPQKVVNELDAA